MRTFLKIGLCLLLAAGFTACEKDETPVVGRLELIYDQTALATNVYIYTEIGNIIYEKTNPGNKLSIDLNPGNYAILSSTHNGGGAKEYFQIQAGRTTKITHNDYLNPTVKYE